MDDQNLAALEKNINQVDNGKKNQPNKKKPSQLIRGFLTEKNLSLDLGNP